MGVRAGFSYYRALTSCSRAENELDLKRAFSKPAAVVSSPLKLDVKNIQLGSNTHKYKSGSSSACETFMRIARKELSECVRKRA